MEEIRNNWLGIPALTLLGLMIANPAYADGAFDGVYKGGNELFLNDVAGCSPANRFSTGIMVLVTDGRFEAEWGLPAEFFFKVHVKVDGSFYASEVFKGDVYEIGGRIVGDSFEADIGSAKCQRHISATRWR